MSRQALNTFKENSEWGEKCGWHRRMRVPSFYLTCEMYWNANHFAPLFWFLFWPLCRLYLEPHLNSLHSAGINQVFRYSLLSVNKKCYRTKVRVLLHWKKQCIGKDYFFLRLQCNTICATLMSSCAQWKSINVSHLMSIFRKSDTNQFMCFAHSANWKCLTSTKNVHFIHWQNNIIAFCLFVHLTWLTHNTYGTKVPKLEKKNKIHKYTQSKQKMLNSYRIERDKLFTIHNF